MVTEGSPISPSIGIPIVIGLLALSAFFSSSEAGLFSLQPAEIEGLKERGKKGKRVIRLLREPHKTLASVLMGNELVNISLSTICAGMIISLFPNKSWINLLVATPLLVLLGEITPKVFALRHRSSLAQLIAPPLIFWATITAPVRWILISISQVIVSLFRAKNEVLVSSISENQLKTLIDEGHEAGEIHETEADIIHRVFEFNDLPISSLMTPMADIVSVPHTANHADILKVIRASHLSRIPVYRGSTHNMVGVLFSKDMMRFRDRPASRRELKGLWREPYFVPASKMADDLLNDFQRYRIHLAFVVNEHGTLLGLITMDDLIGELIGEAHEQEEPDTSELTRTIPDAWKISANMSGEDFESQTGVDITTETVGEFVNSKLSGPAEVGLEVHIGGITFRINELIDNSISEILVVTHEGEE